MGRPEAPTAEWSISEQPDGWELIVKHRTPASFLLPRYLRRNLPIAVLVVGVIWMIATSLVWKMVSLESALLMAPLTALASALLMLIAWPVRFGRGTSSRYLPDGTVLHRYYELRYFEANRSTKVRSVDGKVDVRGNVFLPEHLCSLRLDEQVNDGFPGLVDLVFDGSVVSRQQVVGWPGMPEAEATALRDALIARAREAGAGTLTSAST